MSNKRVSLGEKQTKLLAKIEELTLHMIEAEKTTDQIASNNRQLREKLENVRNKLPAN